jgi:hypothetical protein
MLKVAEEGYNFDYFRKVFQVRIEKKIIFLKKNNPTDIKFLLKNM